MKIEIDSKIIAEALKENWDDLIKEVKSDFDFDDEFDLIGELIEVGRLKPALDYFYEQIPSTKKSSEEMQQLKLAADKLLKSFDETSPYVLGVIDAALLDIDKLKSNIHNPDENSRLTNILRAALEVVLRSIAKIEPEFKHEKGSKDSQKRRVLLVHKLAVIYKHGTGEDPKCGHENGKRKRKESVEGKHKGRFYEFLLSIRNILKVLGVDIGGTELSIGQAANEACRMYRKTKNLETVPD